MRGNRRAGAVLPLPRHGRRGQSVGRGRGARRAQARRQRGRRRHRRADGADRGRAAIVRVGRRHADAGVGPGQRHPVRAGRPGGGARAHHRQPAHRHRRRHPAAQGCGPAGPPGRRARHRARDGAGAPAPGQAAVGQPVQGRHPQRRRRLPDVALPARQPATAAAAGRESRDPPGVLRRAGPVAAGGRHGAQPVAGRRLAQGRGRSRRHQPRRAQCRHPRRDRRRQASQPDPGTGPGRLPPGRAHADLRPVPVLEGLHLPAPQFRRRLGAAAVGHAGRAPH